MAAGENVIGKAWIEIIPEMDGIQRTIASDLSDELGEAGDRAGEEAGQRAGRSFGKSFASAAKTAGKAAAGVTAALGGIYAAAQPAMQSMGQLETSFVQTGRTVDDARDTYERFMGLVGDSDRATEAAQDMANLAEAGGDIDEWYTIASGTVARFGDALPVENLIEAA